MAFAAQSLARHRLGQHRRTRSRPSEIGPVEPARPELAGPAPVAYDRAPRRAVHRKKLGTHLLGLAMAQRAEGAAHVVEHQAVAALAVPLHVHRKEAHTIGGRLLAILAFERGPIAQP